MRYAIYGETRIQIQEGVAMEAVKDALSAVYPELKNSTVAVNGEGNFVFTVATATKGATRYAIYGETRIQIQEGVSMEAVKDALTAVYPELKNSTVSINAEGNYVFTVATATKGATRYAIYGETRIQVQEGVSMEAVKDALAAVYPELRNSTVAVNPEGNFVFTVATATKGK